MRSWLSAALMTLLALTLLPLTAGTAAAAPTCSGTWTVAVGGMVWGPQTSNYFNADQPVGYPGLDANAGLRELDRLITVHRTQCPGDHVKIIGHSQGAAIVHAWVSAHPSFANVNAILLADPKRPAGPGGAGLSSLGGFLGYPLAGVDANYGPIPVLSVCNHNDGICDASLRGAVGYVSGVHGQYDFDANDYSNTASGVWYR